MVHAQFGTASRQVGRDSELRILREQIETAASGQGGTVLVSGEAGIGKSRLIHEIQLDPSVVTRTCCVLQGQCYETDRTLPYGPFLDLLRTTLAEWDDASIREQLAYDLPLLLRLLPELSGRFASVTPVEIAESEQERHWIVQLILKVIDLVAEQGPTLLVLEDLHWSDEASLDLILPIARQVNRMPALMICTYRTDEVNDKLRHMLAMLDRERLAIEISLTGLTVQQLDEMVCTIFDQESTVRPEFLNVLHTLTNGSPYFVEEVLRSLVTAGDIFQFHGRWSRKELIQLRIPRSIQDAVLGRSASLSNDAQQVLDIIAVIGLRISFNLLSIVSEYEENQLLSILSELIDAQLLDDESEGTYRFRHTLAREAIYERMLVRVRRNWHLRIGNALEQLSAEIPEAYLADYLAYHFFSAEQWEKAGWYTQLAGERALLLFAPHAAVDHFTRGIVAFENLGVLPPAAVLHQRGVAFETLGEFANARLDFEKCRSIAESNADLYAKWQALIGLGRTWEGLDYDRAGQLFKEALTAAQELDDQYAIAHSLSRIGTWYTNTERIDEAFEAHNKALSIFYQLDDPSGIATALDYLGSVNDVSGDLSGMQKHLEEAARLFRQIGDQQRLSSTLATMTCLGGNFVYDTVGIPAATGVAETLAWGMEAEELARGTYWRAGEAFATVSIGQVHQWHGKLASALEYARRSLPIAGEINHQEWQSAGYALLGAIYETLRAEHLATKHFTRAVKLARASGSSFFVTNTSGILACLLTATGELERAQRILEEFDADLPVRTLGQRSIWKARGLLALASGEPDRALGIFERLAETAPNAPAWEDIPVLSMLCGKAEAALGRTSRAEELFHSAIRGASCRELLPIVCDAHLEFANLYESMSLPDEMGQQRDAARRVAYDMACGVPDEFGMPYLVFFESKTPEIESQPVSGAPSLTPREQEVANHIARGLTNRQIGDELFIGERTVESHVRNTLAKLGFTSRSQIASWVSAGYPPTRSTD